MAGRTKRVLILCTGNSCRSQMAEFIWRKAVGSSWDVRSAGSKPTGFVHPTAIEVLAEVGLNAKAAQSKSLEEFREQPFDLVVTVCDGARDECPVFPEAERSLHWPFDDPAHATGTEEDVRNEFRRVRDEITSQIEEFLASDPVPPGEFLTQWLGQHLDLAPARILAKWREGYDELTRRTAVLLGEEKFRWAWLPREIEDIFGRRGWQWNGIYARRDDVTLQLCAAAGPPVCATLERRGGVGSSGMCFDGLLMNQTLVASPAKSWLGYHSCDDESGLSTVAGMVVPVRNADGTPIAVWDLDATEPLVPSDPFFFDRYFATLSALLCPQPEDFA